MSKERRERFASGHKKSINCKKTYEKYEFFQVIPSFFASKSLTSFCFKKRQERRSWSLFKMSDFERKSEEGMSKRVTSQAWFELHCNDLQHVEFQYKKLAHPIAYSKSNLDAIKMSYWYLYCLNFYYFISFFVYLE